MGFGVGVMLMAVLSGEPQTAVVISKSTTVPVADVERVADEVAAALTAGGVEVMPRRDAERALAARQPPTTAADCAGKSACLGPLADHLGLRGLVGVFVTEVVGERTALLALVKRGEDKPTLKRDFLVIPNEKIGRVELGDFVEASRALLAPPQVIVSEAPPKDHTSASIVAGGGAATLVAGIVVGALGVVAKSRFDGMLSNAQDYTRPELQAAAAPANTLPPIGIALGVAAAALGGVAVWLW